MSIFVPPCRCGGTWHVTGVHGPENPTPIVICGSCQSLAHPVIAAAVIKSRG